MQLRVDSYNGVFDYLQKRVNGHPNSRIGTVKILPATFKNSHRYTLEHYQDSMALSRKFGPADLFITMTCNPRWREIQENLLPGQQASDRPDLVVRVFNLKVKHLINLIWNKEFFGKCVSYVYSIEFQKRGLPHIHMLVTLAEKLNTPQKIDKFISATIPDPDEDPILYDLVMKHMIHGPCGDVCFENGKCS